MAFLKLASHRLRKLRQLSVSSWLMLAVAAICLPITGAALRLLGFQRSCRFLARFDRAAMSIEGASDDAIDEAKAMAEIVKIAARHGLYRAKCLTESLVLWALLRRRGLPVELRIGARKAENQFEAHAWVELNGIVLNDTHDVEDRYTSFKKFSFQSGPNFK
jgi:hypothetical protein